MLGNDGYPVNSRQQNFTSFVIIVGVFTNAIVIGACASLLLGLDQEAILKQQQFDNINANLAYNKVPTRLAGRVRAYFEYLHSTGHAKDEGELFGDLPRKMQLQLSMNKKKLIESVAIFRNVTPQCTVAIVSALTPSVQLAREYVIIQGQRGDQMFFIARGLVQVTHFVRYREMPLCQLADGAHFGEIALLSEDGKRTANVLTLKNCELQILTRRKFLEFQERFAEFRELVEAESRKRITKGEQMGRDQRTPSAPRGLIHRWSSGNTRAAKIFRRAIRTTVAANRLSRGGRSSKVAAEACCWTAEAADRAALKVERDVFGEASAHLSKQHFSRVDAVRRGPATLGSNQASSTRDDAPLAVGDAPNRWVAAGRALGSVTPERRLSRDASQHAPAPAGCALRDIVAAARRYGADEAARGPLPPESHACESTRAAGMLEPIESADSVHLRSVRSADSVDAGARE